MEVLLCHAIRSILEVCGTGAKCGEGGVVVEGVKPDGS